MSAPPSLEDFFDAAWGGDEGAMSHLFHMSYSRVRRMVTRRVISLLRSSYDSSDVSGEVCNTLVMNPRNNEFDSVEVFG